MTQLICYDISNNNLRTQIGKKIIKYGLDRINKSVYLGSITENALQELETLLCQLILQKGEPNDSLIIIPVTPSQIQNMRIYGHNDLDKDELAGDKTTLIL